MTKLNEAAKAVARLIAERDNLDLADAEALVEEAIEMCEAAIHAGEDPEDIWMEETGLEPDYMLEVLL